MKKIGFAVLALMGALAAAPAAFGDETYEGQGYAFKVPSECTAPAAGAGSFVLRCKGFTISVTKVLFQSPAGLDEFAQQNVYGRAAALKVVDKGKASMGSKPVAYMVALAGATQSTKTKQYAFVWDKAGYVVSVSGPVKEFSGFVRTADSVVKSFKVL